jgi:hypothetical protein
MGKNFNRLFLGGKKIYAIFLKLFRKRKFFSTIYQKCEVQINFFLILKTGQKFCHFFPKKFAKIWFFGGSGQAAREWWFNLLEKKRDNIEARARPGWFLVIFWKKSLCLVNSVFPVMNFGNRTPDSSIGNRILFLGINFSFPARLEHRKCCRKPTNRER